jgi:hypothetical protein
MPGDNEKGTGRHPHKSTEEPWPHHESGNSEQSGGSQSQARSGNQENADLNEREYRDAQGEVHHHTPTFEDQHNGSNSGQEGEHRSSAQPQSDSGNQSNRSGDLQERKYRDKEGDEHHHTRTYEEQHRKAS